MVEWKTIGEITNIVRGNRITKSELLDNGIYPVISGGVTPLGYIDKYNREPNTITIAQYGSAGYIDYQQKKFWANDVCYSVYPKSSVDNKYLFYALVNKQYDIYSLRTNAVPAHLPLKSLQDVKIPIPSLEEQNRIVGILDTFTDSIENLKQQIAQRRKQYEHYRDQLLDLEGKEGVEMKTLEDCAILISDGDHQPPPKTQQGIPFITISNINKDNHKIDFSNTFFVPKEYYESIKNERKAKEGDVLYTVTGSYGIPVNIDFAKEFCFQRHIAMIRPNIDVLLSKFLYHSLLTVGVKKQADENASGGAQKTVSLSSLRKFIIYVPSLSEQQRIVSILDTFEANISNLEAQLAQRQKQYEYYRNQLLTFE